MWLAHLRERELWEDLGIYGKIILIFLIINIKVIIINMGWEDMGWVYVAYDTDRGPAVVNAVVNLRVDMQ